MIVIRKADGAMGGECYRFAQSGKLIPAGDVQPGTLAHIAGQKQPILCLTISDQERGWLELGGERASTIWSAEHEDGTAWTVSDWRLELDPTSMVDAQYASLTKGHAFLHGDRAGLIGALDRRRGSVYYLPVGTDGASTNLPHGEHKVFFSRWRIVVSDLGGDWTLVDDEGKCGGADR